MEEWGKVALRIVGGLGLWLALWYPLGVGIGDRLGWRPWQPVKPEQKLPLVLSLYALSPIVIISTFWKAGYTWGDYGVHPSWSELVILLLGLGMAIAGLAVTFGVQIYGGLVQWQGSGFGKLWPLLIPLTTVALAIGGLEELLFRGLYQTQLQTVLTPWGAAGVISTLFALLHLLWERQLTRWQLPGLWLLGLVLTVARWGDGGNLALAWGLHSGWVLGLAALDTTGLITYPDDQGNPWVGKGNQPLAGVGGILCLLGTGLIIVLGKTLAIAFFEG